MGTAIKANRGGGGKFEVTNGNIEEFFSNENIEPNTFIEFNGEISYGNLQTLFYPNTYCSAMRIKKISSTKFVYYYGYSTSCQVGIMNYANGTFTKEVEVALSTTLSGSTYDINLEVVNSTSFLIVTSVYYSDTVWHQVNAVRYVESSKSLIQDAHVDKTLINSLQGATSDAYNYILPLSNNKYAVVFPKRELISSSYIGAMNYAIVTIGSDSSTGKLTLSVGTTTKLDANREYFNALYKLPCLILSTTKFIFITYDGDYKLCAVFVTSNGTSLSIASKVQLTNVSVESDERVINAILVNSTKFIVSYWKKSSGLTSYPTQGIIEGFKISGNSCTRIKKFLLNNSDVKLLNVSSEVKKNPGLILHKGYILYLFRARADSSDTQAYIHLIAIDQNVLDVITDEVIIANKYNGTFNCPMIEVDNSVTVFLPDTSNYPQSNKYLYARKINLSDINIKKSDVCIHGLLTSKATTTKKGKVAILNE